MVQELDLVSGMDVRLLGVIGIEQYVVGLLKTVAFAKIKGAAYSFETRWIDARNRSPPGDQVACHSGGCDYVRDLHQPANQLF
jgi:hypothetical protein